MPPRPRTGRCRTSAPGLTLAAALALAAATACAQAPADGAGMGPPLQASAADRTRVLHAYRAVALADAAATAYVAGRSADVGDCAVCHTPDTSAPAPRPAPEQRAAHWQIALDHAAGMTCRDCHDPRAPASLHLLGDNRTDLDRAYQTCARCHQGEVADWRGGAHGKRLSGWAEPRVIAGCAACHDPHAPALAPRLPVAQPSIVPPRVLPPGGHR